MKNPLPYRTEVICPKANFEINHSNQIFLIGSCFSDNIFTKFNQHKFAAEANPYGVIYNPISISNFLSRVTNQNFYVEDDIEIYNEQYFNFEHHTSLNSLSKDEHLNQLNRLVKSQQQILKNTKFLFITFGTAYVYHHIYQNIIVANCHKLPNTHFEKKRLSTKQILDTYTLLLTEIEKFNPNCKIIFTVSPVRHWKDGVIENQRSKATLHLAIDYLQQQFEQVSYFPSYEIVMDELRDYRFYSPDMLHPNQQAIDLIWHKLSSTYFNEKTLILNKEISSLLKQYNHKPFNKNSEAHKTALDTLHQKMIEFQNENEAINFEKELDSIKQTLAI